MSVDQTDDTQLVSRRRQAIVAGPLRDDDNMFTMADVAALQHDRTAASRIQIAHRLGISLDNLKTGNTRDLAQGILALLVRDVETEVRQALAAAVAKTKSLPVDVATTLATDDIDIARPILEHSPVLTDEILIDIVRTNALQYALAVAGREQISEGLSQTLVEHGDETVVVRLVGNLGAKLSERTLLQIIDDYASSSDVNSRLVQRPALPSNIIEEMVNSITHRLTWDMIGRKEMDSAQARVIIEAVRERAKAEIDVREQADHQRMDVLRETYEAGELHPELLMTYLRDGDIAGFEVGMSLLSKLPVDEVRRLVYEPDRRYLSGLCVRSNFSAAHYITLRMALELAEVTVTGEITHRGYNTESIRRLQRQYEVLQNDELALDELIYGE